MQNLKPKQQLTIFSISDWMAHTTKTEIEVVSVLPEPEPRRAYQNGPIEGQRLGSMKIRGKRKPFYLDVKTGDLVFEGWDLPILSESEVRGGSFSGNACFNIGLRTPMSEARLDTIFLRAFIEEKNINGPLSDEVRGKCICVRGGSPMDCDGELIWPEVEVAHAVVNRMKEKLAA